MGNLFDQNKDDNQPPAEVKLDDLVGEGKKYATVEELAKAYVHADHHISKVQAENNDLRVKAEAAKSVDDILAGLKGTQGQQEPEQKDDTQDPDKSSTGQVDIEKLLEQKLAERDQQSTQAANKKAVIDALSAKFGNRAAEVFDAKEKELGVNLEELSATAPALVLQSFGVSEVSPSSSASLPTSSQRNNDQPDGVTAEVGTKTYLMQLRKAGKLTRSEYYAECQKAISADAKKFNS